MRNSEKRTWGIRILFLIGFLLCCIPLLSGVIEKRRQAEAVATYQEAAEKETASFEELYRKAEEYNDMLYQSGGAMVDGMTEDLLSEESYQKQLALSETGIMGSLEIPKINVNLLIYHGTGEEALANGVGHLEGSSLPIGGENTHSVLSGHRGLPSSKLLVRLDEIEEGGIIIIKTTRTEDDLYITVTDNGIGFSEEALQNLTRKLGEEITFISNSPSGTSDNIGVINIHNKIRLYEGNNYGISIDSAPNHTSVTLHLNAKQQITT